MRIGLASDTCAPLFEDKNFDDSENRSIRKLFDELCYDGKCIHVEDAKSQIESIMKGSAKPLSSGYDENSNAAAKKTGPTMVSFKEWMEKQKAQIPHARNRNAPVVSWESKEAETRVDSRGPSPVASDAAKLEVQKGCLESEPACTTLQSRPDQDHVLAADAHDALACDCTDAQPELDSVESPHPWSHAATADGPHSGELASCSPSDVPRPCVWAAGLDSPDAVKAARALADGDWEAASRICTAMIEAGQPTFAAFYVRAESCRLRGLLAAAVDDFGFCLAIDSSSARAHKGRGICLVELGRYAQAAVHLKHARRLQQTADSLTAVSLGRCYEELGETMGALHEYDTAITADPGNAYALFCRGRCLQHVGDEAAAARDLARVVQLDPLFASRYLHMAAEAEARGCTDMAAGVYQSLECLPLSHEQLSWLKARRAQLWGLGKLD